MCYSQPTCLHAIRSTTTIIAAAMGTQKEEEELLWLCLVPSPLYVVSIDRSTTEESSLCFAWTRNKHTNIHSHNRVICCVANIFACQVVKCETQEFADSSSSQQSSSRWNSAHTGSYLSLFKQMANCFPNSYLVNFGASEEFCEMARSLCTSRLIKLTTSSSRGASTWRRTNIIIIWLLILERRIRQIAN